MNDATIEDIRAAEELLGVEGPHEKVRGLEGSDRCTHILTGSGGTIETMVSLSEDAKAQWYRHPYRHHVYTPEVKSGADWCKCGNAKANAGHQQCWVDPLIETTRDKQLRPKMTVPAEMVITEIGTDWWTVPSSSDPNKSYTVERRHDGVNGGTYLFCECPSWKFQRGRGKDCKHVTAVKAL